MARRVKVTYLDGRVIECLASPRAQVMTEQHIQGRWTEHLMLSTYYLAWAALHKAGKEAADFETFLDLIEDAEDIDTTVDPTPPAPSADTSSD